MQERSAGMPVYLGISCVKGGRGERRGGGRVEKEVESSTTLAGVTLEELEQTLLGKKQGKGGGSAHVNPGSLDYLKIWSVNITLDQITAIRWILPKANKGFNNLRSVITL